MSAVTLDRPPQSASSQAIRNSLPCSITVGTAVLVAYLPLATLHFRALWRREQYQYFPFVVGAFGYLLYLRWQEGSPRTGVGLDRRTTFSKICYGIAWAIFAGAVLIQSPWLAMVSLNILLAGVLCSISQTRFVRNLWGIWLMLWLLVPLPFDFDTRIVVKLQAFSSRISSNILDYAGVRHLMAGNTLQLPDKQFFVDEACSGIVSVMSVIAVGLIWAVWNNRTLIHLGLLVLAGVGWALSLNVARICIITFAHAWWNTDLSEGTPHEILGLCLFTLTFIALISTDRLLYFALQPIEGAGAQPAGEKRQNPIVRAWNRLAHFVDPTVDPADVPSKGDQDTNDATPAGTPASPAKLGNLAAGGFVLLGAISIVPIVIATQNSFQAVDHALAVNREFLPAEIGSLVLEDYKEAERPNQSELGDYSRLFIYRDRTDNRLYSISFDFPFAGGWHELCVCYRNTGWTMLERKVNVPEQEETEWPVVLGEFSRGESEHGYLAFSNFNGDGMAMGPPTDLIFWQPWRRVRRRLLRTLSSQVFQVQVWTDAETPVTDLERERVEQTLLEVRGKFRDYFERTP